MTEPLINVRCITCGKVMGGFQEPYEKYVMAGGSREKFADENDITRFCCRRSLFYPPMVLSSKQEIHEDLTDQNLYFNDVGPSDQGILSMTVVDGKGGSNISRLGESLGMFTLEAKEIKEVKAEPEMKVIVMGEGKKVQKKATRIKSRHGTATSSGANIYVGF